MSEPTVFSVLKRKCGLICELSALRRACTSRPLLAFQKPLVARAAPDLDRQGDGEDGGGEDSQVGPASCRVVEGEDHLPAEEAVDGVAHQLGQHDRRQAGDLERGLRAPVFWVEDQPPQAQVEKRADPPDLLGPRRQVAQQPAHHSYGRVQRHRQVLAGEDRRQGAQHTGDQAWNIAADDARQQAALHRHLRCRVASRRQAYEAAGHAESADHAGQLQPLQRRALFAQQQAEEAVGAGQKAGNGSRGGEFHHQDDELVVHARCPRRGLRMRPILE